MKYNETYDLNSHIKQTLIDVADRVFQVRQNTKTGKSKIKV